MINLPVLGRNALLYLQFQVAVTILALAQGTNHGIILLSQEVWRAIKTLLVGRMRPVSYRLPNPGITDPLDGKISHS